MLASFLDEFMISWAQRAGHLRDDFLVTFADIQSPCARVLYGFGLALWSRRWSIIGLPDAAFGLKYDFAQGRYLVSKAAVDHFAGELAQAVGHGYSRTGDDGDGAIWLPE